MEWNFTMEFSHDFFFDPEVIFISHTMFINASTNEFTLENNAIPNYDIAFEHYYTTRLPVFTEILTLSFKNTKTKLFHFNLSIISFHANLKFS